MFNDQLDRAMVLEMARLHSINHHSELVLCTNFLPWLDLALSADSEGEFLSIDWRLPMDVRWLEVADFVLGASETQRPNSGQCAALTSFGLLRCWHSAARTRFARAYGPIRHVVEGGRWFDRVRWPA